MSRNVDLPSKVVLVDREGRLAREWTKIFEPFDEVSAVQGDFFAEPADAMVSPANSYGFMDGGLDLAIRDVLGMGIQRRVQERILEKHHGEMPVGHAEIVETGDARWPWLVAAPTMRVPEQIGRTLHPYLAFRALLLEVCRFNRVERRIDSLRCPGLGTGVGGVEPVRCAIQMKMAWAHVCEPARIPGFDRIHAVHQAMLRA